MQLTTATYTDVGRVRDRNEDAVLCTPLEPLDGRLLAVADGMGAHRAGDVASETAIETVQDSVGRYRGKRSVRAVLREGIETANTRLQSLAQADPSRAGLGTTLVAAIVTGDEITIANVGDSRAYLVGDGITQVTTDQTVVQQLETEGVLSADEAGTHPHRHVLTQALGTTDDIAPEWVDADLGDRTLLLCSDGLTEEVSDAEIEAIVRRESEPATTAERLVDRANRNGGSDNISVVLARRSDGA